MIPCLHFLKKFSEHCFTQTLTCRFQFIVATILLFVLSIFVQTNKYNKCQRFTRIIWVPKIGTRKVKIGLDWHLALDIFNITIKILGKTNLNYSKFYYLLTNKYQQRQNVQPFGNISALTWEGSYT